MLPGNAFFFLHHIHKVLIILVVYCTKILETRRENTKTGFKKTPAGAGACDSSLLIGWLQAHAVVLGLPARVCAERAASRVGHEGGVQGAAAPRVVHMMHRQFVKAGPPSTAEGLASIMVCSL